MGHKASFIVIEKAENAAVSETEILDALGFEGWIFEGETTFEECIYLRDSSLCLGFYRGNLIVCNVALLDEFFGGQGLSRVEQSVSQLFPDREILAIACHSVVNYHGYALLKNGQKMRQKTVSSDSPVEGFGELIEEEKAIYERSEVDANGRRFWKVEGLDDEFLEDQLMEDFAFGVAKRLLGIKISTSEDEELSFETPFKKFVKPTFFTPKSKAQTAQPTEIDEDETMKKWMTYIRYFVYFLLSFWLFKKCAGQVRI